MEKLSEEARKSIDEMLQGTYDKVYPDLIKKGEGRLPGTELRNKIREGLPTGTEARKAFDALPTTRQELILREKFSQRVYKDEEMLKAKKKTSKSEEKKEETASA